MIEKIERNNFLCNLDIRVRKYPGKMARQNFGRFVKTIKTLRFNKNIHQKTVLTTSLNALGALFKSTGFSSKKCIDRKS